MPKDNIIVFPLRDSQSRSQVARATKLPARNSEASHTLLPWPTRSFADVYAEWKRRYPSARPPKGGKGK